MNVPVQFGTDGIRGRAFDEISVDLAYRLGVSVARVFDAPVFVGYDTRESSPPLAGAVLAGLAEGGAHGTNLGPFTTPGVSVIARQRGGIGVVVSASHNPFYDNGLKVLGPGGGKLDHATEEAVSRMLTSAPSAPSDSFPEVAIDETGLLDYAHHLGGLVPVDFSTLHVVLDCANGAASPVARALFVANGARVTMLHDQPNGRNINERCGSTHVEDLAATVLEVGADLGLAFDGDADRLIAVDAKGQVRDGDDLMVVLALDLAERDLLGGGVVVTLMSNLGLHRALRERGLEIVETNVGDRNVLMALEERSWNFGGEQSGHLIFRNLAPTGDGLLTGLLVTELVVRCGSLDHLASAAWQREPQELINVSRERYNDDYVHLVFEELRVAKNLAPEDVRLFIRPSGTEPVVRVMVEAHDDSFVREFTERLVNFFHA